MLTETVFRTEDLGRAERFDAWRECMRRTVAPMEVTSHRLADFAASQRLLHLGRLSVWASTVQPCRYRRGPRDIRSSDPELYHLTLVLPGSGTLATAQAGNSDASHGRDIYLIDTSRPCEVWSPPGGSPVVGIGMEIPKPLVPLSPLLRPHVDRLLGRQISGRRGFGLLLAQTLVQLVGGEPGYRPSDVPRLNALLADLVAGMLAQESETTAGLPAGTRDRTLVLRVREYVRQNLRDPGLSPVTVAAAHHLSTRQLHRLFEAEEETVAGLIRAGRLEAARRALTDPARRAVPVHAVAADWGFTSPAHFSRAFRAAYGAPPGDYRRRAFAPRPDTGRRGTARGGALSRKGDERLPGPGRRARPGQASAGGQARPE
ncbi:AraC family transcriptional regulator [Streptomyces carminius]|uniref:AraC family transcriptional regulator n=1 Tax=Streptomyces carminius TaxID=2665496 RepID=A0A2M8M4M1_9ACTN|nr:helix-turn-helix domain-containing protein [Streptomyces carminius]PJE99162.1 AraC family transcriptional regulator [Streptomyces carminius]